jgi:Enoyl-CoA hydratase/isomerase
VHCTVGGVEVRRAAEVAEIAASPLAADLVDDVVVVDLREMGPTGERASTLPCVVVGITGSDDHPAGVADVVVADEAAAEPVVAAARASPIAATALVLHLRASEHLPVPDALVAESAVYSLLQAGPEHRRWLAARPPRPTRENSDERVRVTRRGRTVHVALARPAVRNAVDGAMQQALVDALAAVGDGDEVLLTGDGPVFSAGGDLAEFGTLADPASAHLLRLRRSPARALARVAERTTVVVQGACHGAGVELPAFAHQVVARPGTTFTLPEVTMGLVPGAGGTASLPRRIGRQRTAWLAITGAALDATTAQRWGLVDEIAAD